MKHILNIIVLHAAEKHHTSRIPRAAIWLPEVDAPNSMDSPEEVVPRKHEGIDARFGRLEGHVRRRIWAGIVIHSDVGGADAMDSARGSALDVSSLSEDVKRWFSRAHVQHIHAAKHSLGTLQQDIAVGIVVKQEAWATEMDVHDEER